jgi:hypothetical protein
MASKTGAGAASLREDLSPLDDDAEDLTVEEQETVALVTDVRDSRSLHPLVTRLANGEIGPERARDALLVLAEYDVHLLAQVTLDTITGKRSGPRPMPAGG